MPKRPRDIPYVDIAGQHAAIRDELLGAAGRVIDHGQFILGPEVAEFEQKFAALCDAPFAIGVNSGTDAIILALRALGVGAGDEVITAANTFVATASAIVMAGARPVLVDVAEDLNIDPALIPRAVTAKTRAIVPVHLTGRPADMDAILDLARRHGLAVVEDAAQAVAARYKGRSVGSLGDAGCFSLHPLKTLNACGDGGVLTVRDPALAEKLRKMRNIGLESRENAALWSGNSRLDTIHAAMLLVKLARLQEWTETRRSNARFYLEHLSGIPELLLPAEKAHEYCVYHTFVVQADNRDGLKTHLTGKGIGSAIHYPIPIHLQTVGREIGYGEGDFPVAEAQAKKILSLPIHCGLSRSDMDRVVSEIRAFYKAGK